MKHITGVLVIALLVASVTSVSASVYYVSPAGSDAHDGRGPEATRALRTLQAGVDKLQPGDTLLVRGGVYRETVTFHHSGTPGHPISVQPYQNEKVLITGCEPISGWTRYKGNIWQAPMPWTLGLGRNEVFVNGQVTIEARFPNKPSPGLGMYVSGLSPLWPTFGAFSIPDPKTPGRVVSKLLDGEPDNYWKGALYYGVHYEGWCAQTGIIESSKSGEITVGDRTQGWWFPGPHSGYKPEEGRGMIVGTMHALDQPGEWVWQDKTLYLIPPHGDGPPVNVEAKRRQLAFDLSGQQYIKLTGLTVRAASMLLRGSAYCTVDRCDLSYITHFIQMYGMGQVAKGRDTMKDGETGIYISGHDNSFLNCSIRISAGAGFYLRGYHHTIHNCLIDQVDYSSHYLNAITDAVGDYNNYENFLVGGHVITYNTMCNAGRHFFNFYGNGTSLASRDRGPMDYMATLFAHNHLYNGMLETKDAGFITGYYCSGGTLDGLNSQVEYNVMHDSYDIFGMRIHKLGIVYLDAGTCNVDLHDNLLWAAPGSLQHGLWFNTMCVDVNSYDNVFHPDFTRTCAQLKPSDFPNGKPFRFGCDFANPPPVPKWPQLVKQRLQAEDCTSAAADAVKTDGHVQGLRNGDWLAFNKVDFSKGWQSAVLHFASGVKELNTDRSARARPRHHKATDPLVMEATVNDGMAEGIHKQWSFVHNVHNGSWLRFSKVPLGEGYRRFRVVYGNDQKAPRWLEVHLDAVDGPLVTRVNLPQTDKPREGSIQIYEEAVGQVSPAATGTHDVYVVFHAPDDQPVGAFEYFRFERYRGQLPLQKTEVKIELHVGSRTGEKIGEFYPRYTGGAADYRDLVARLEPTSGNQPLYLVVRSALPGPIGSLDWLSLQKAKHPLDLTGIVAPPLTRNGKLVLPQPTNLPCAKPNDKYAKAAAAFGNRLRPLFAVTRLTSVPTMDGKATWASRGQAMTLKESWDGSLSAGQPCSAHVGYDDRALYVAVSVPVKEPTKLNFASHVWGSTDAMELAFQDGLGSKPGPILNLYGWPDGHFVSTDRAGAPEAAVKQLGQAVTYRAAIGPAGWSGEWRIPFAATGFTPKTAPLLLFNLGVRQLATDSWVVWRGTGGPNYLVNQAGILVFPSELLASPTPPRDKLEVWLDAADEKTVQRDAAGKVEVWKDKSGHGRDARQTQPGFRPRYLATGLNGKPALQFDEKSRTRLELPDLSDKKISATIFAVFSNPWAGSQVNHDERLFTASDGKAFDYQSGLCCSIPNMETGGPRQTVATFTNRWAKHVHVGCFSPNYQTFFTGDLSEILVYSGVMTRDQQDRVRAYLMAKWGLK